VGLRCPCRYRRLRRQFSNSEAKDSCLTLQGSRPSTELSGIRVLRPSKCRYGARPVKWRGAPQQGYSTTNLQQTINSLTARLSSSNTPGSIRNLISSSCSFHHAINTRFLVATYMRSALSYHRKDPDGTPEVALTAWVLSRDAGSLRMLWQSLRR